MGNIERESFRHAEAFNYYYSMGSLRTMKQVAAKYGVSLTAVKKWSQAFDWSNRIELRDVENARRLEKKVDTAVVNAKASYRKIIQLSISKFVLQLQAQKVNIETIQDLERLIKLDLLLMGEATERSSAEMPQTMDLSRLTDKELEILEKATLRVSGPEPDQD